MLAASAPARHFRCAMSVNCESIAYFTEFPMVVPDDAYL